MKISPDLEKYTCNYHPLTTVTATSYWLCMYGVVRVVSPLKIGVTLLRVVILTAATERREGALPDNLQGIAAPKVHPCSPDKVTGTDWTRRRENSIDKAATSQSTEAVATKAKKERPEPKIFLSLLYIFLSTIAKVIVNILLFMLYFISDKPEMKSGSSVIKSWINHETEVTCEAEGVPAPEIIWTRNGTVTSSTTIYSRISTLQFTPQEKNEFGILLCTAKNLLGIAKRNITVKQLGKKNCSLFQMLASLLLFWVIIKRKGEQSVW